MKDTPDLFFVEESVNDDQDGHFDRVHAIRGMEGIVRRVREKRPRCESVENFWGKSLIWNSLA